jgi:hypothetical protein
MREDPAQAGCTSGMTVLLHCHCLCLITYDICKVHGSYLTLAEHGTCHTSVSHRAQMSKSVLRHRRSLVL